MRVPRCYWDKDERLLATQELMAPRHGAGTGYVLIEDLKVGNNTVRLDKDSSNV